MYIYISYVRDIKLYTRSIDSICEIVKVSSPPFSIICALHLHPAAGLELQSFA